MLKLAAGLDIVHVPFRGSPYSTLLAGEIHAMFETMPAPLPFLESGKIRALALTGSRRLPAIPDVPTFAEVGIPNIDAHFWWGVVGPAGMPRSVVDKLNAEIALALADPSIVATFARFNIAPTGGSAEAFGTHIAQEHARWKEFGARSGVQLD